MTNEEFCEGDTSFHGEKVDNIKQIALRTFDGEELKEYVEHFIRISQQCKHGSQYRVYNAFSNVERCGECGEITN